MDAPLAKARNMTVAGRGVGVGGGIACLEGVDGCPQWARLLKAGNAAVDLGSLVSLGMEDSGMAFNHSRW